MLSTHWVMTDNVAKKWARLDRRSPDHAMGCDDRHSCSDEIHCQCHICWFRWPPRQIPPCSYPARWVKPPWQPWQGARGGSWFGKRTSAKKQALSWDGDWDRFIKARWGNKQRENNDLHLPARAPAAQFWTAQSPWNRVILHTSHTASRSNMAAGETSITSPGSRGDMMVTMKVTMTQMASMQYSASLMTKTKMNQSTPVMPPLTFLSMLRPSNK